MTPQPRELLALGGVAVLAVLVARLVGLLPPVQAFERALYDLRVARLTPPAPTHPGIVVVAIDEATLARFPYRSPVDRAFLADLVESLRRKGARMIGLDVLIDQPTRPADDARLRAVMAGPGAPAVGVGAGAGIALTARQRAYHERFYRGLARGDGGFVVDSADQVVRGQRPAGGGPIDRTLAGSLAESAGVRLPGGAVKVAYLRPSPGAPPFAVYPASVVGLLPETWLRGRTALVGPVLPLDDRHPTPLRLAGGDDAAGTPGVIVHAHQLAQLLDGRRVVEPGPFAALALDLAAAAAGVGLILLRLAWPWRLVAGLLLLAGLGGGAFTLYAEGGPMVGMTTPGLALLTGAFVAGARAEAAQRARRRFIHDAFERYLAPSVVARLVARPETLNLGGEWREISVVFTDLEGFTSFVEAMPPERIAPTLSAYLGGIIDQAFAHEGMIDKIVGDAVVIFFNAPEDQPDHAERAVACALAIDRFAEDFRRRATAEGIGRTRVGVHAGRAVVGNFGTARRFNYTAHGDVVNTAARLEAANKALGTRVCVSGAVAERCPSRVFRPIGDLALRGRRTDLAAFAPVEPGRDEAAYAAAYDRMAAGAPDALAAFEALAACHPADPLARLHRDRLRRGEAGRRVDLTRPG